MQRLIGLVYPDDRVKGYVLWDEQNELSYAVSCAEMIKSLDDGTRYRNIEYKDRQIYCRDCAIEKLPRYDSRGNLKSAFAPMFILATKGTGYILLDTIHFSTSLIYSDSLRNMLRTNPDSVANAYLRGNSIVFKCKDTIEVL